MAPRLPVLFNGDPTYSTGNPVYDSGDDLIAVTSSTNFFGTYAKEIAEFILAGNGVRMVWTSDSQWSGGTDRGYAATVWTWPVQWSTLYGGPVAGDPVAHLRSNTTVAYMIGSQWNDTDTGVSGTAPGGETNVGDYLTSEGIGAPEEIPIPFGIFDDVNTGNSCGSIANNHDYYQDADLFDSASGVLMRYKQAYLSGGSTTAPTAVDFRSYHYNSGGSQTYDGNTVADTSSGSGATKVTLGSSNNNAALEMFTTDAFTSYTSSVNYRPSLVLYENGQDFDNLTLFALGGQAQRMVDASTPEDNTSICLVRYCAGMNPWMFISGGDNSDATKNNHGADATIRAWMWINFGNPNVLCYSYGHNFPVRTGTGFKAESTYQADLFDLIYQDANDYKSANGDWPYVLLFLPWKAGNMDQTRHDEMLGVVRALEQTGIKTIGIDNFNFVGGTSFTAAAPSSPTDYENETTFELDGDGDPDGTGVHPNSANDARIAWYSVYRILQEAAASGGSGLGARRGSRLSILLNSEN